MNDTHDHDNTQPAHDAPPPATDTPRIGKRVVVALIVACVALFLGDLLYVIGLVKHKPHFAFEGWFAFYAWFAFACCIAAVIVTKLLRIVTQREEDYYD